MGEPETKPMQAKEEKDGDVGEKKKMSIVGGMFSKDTWIGNYDYK